MAEFIEILSDSALKEVETLNKRLLETVENIDKINAKSKNMLTPSGANSAVKDLTAQYKEQEKTIASLQAKLEKATAQNTKNIERQRLAEIKLAQDREKAFDKFERQAQREQARLETSVNIYNKTQRQLNLIQAEYNNLAAKKERYNNLTAFEEKRLATLQKVTEKYNTTLKAVDGAIGKYTRNVGNYGSAFNPVQNSIAQLTREMPAFANSVKTGFMAISNNLPIFFDSMQQAIAQQKELQAQGLPSKNALQIFASGFFSLSSAIGIVVTLLTVLAPKIIESISNSDKKAKALELQKQKQEELNKIEAEYNTNMAKNLATEQVRLNVLLSTAKNQEISLKARKNAIKELKDTYPEYLGKLSEQEFLEGKTADAVDKLNKALYKRAMFLAIQEKITSVTKELLEVELRNAVQNAESTKKLYDYENQTIKTTNAKKKFRLATDEDRNSTKGLNDQVNSYNKTLSKHGGTVNAVAYEEAKQRLGLKQTLDVLYSLLNGYDGFEKSLDRNTKKTKENNKAKEESFKFGTEKWIQNEINNLEELRGKTATNTSQYKEYTGAIAFHVKWLEKLRGEQQKQIEDEEKKQSLIYGSIAYYEKLQNELRAIQELSTNNDEYLNIQRQIDFYQVLIDRIKGVTNETKKAKEETIDWGNYIKGFKDDFFQKAGFDKVQFLIENFEKLKEDGKATALAISEAFQQSFNTISEMSNQNYQVAFENLERQKNIAIQFAGDSTTAKEEIERQYEERRRRLEMQRAQQQKRMAIFNATIDMAQAIIGAWANPGFPMAIPLTALIAGLGAAQIAAISSQQIPAYEKGTEHHKGGLMLVNDAKGSNYKETIITPNGKVFKPQVRNVLMNAPKGTKVKTAEWTENLNNILLSNGINGVNQSNTVINPIVNVETKDNYHFEVNEGGFKTFIKRGQAKTEILNGRFRQQKRNY